MIAPEPEGRSNSQTSLVALLRNNLLVAALLFIGLEIYNPCFYLMDDNLDSGMPFLTEMGRHLVKGQSPFVTDYLYGGNYNMLRDATFFVWHPVFMAVSLLGATPYYYLILDVCAFIFLMINVSGFVSLAWYLRKLSETDWSDGWLMFFTLSFNFSIMALSSGASWLNYMVSNGALPWLTLGILLTNRRTSFGLIALVSLHQILGGHPLALISNSIFLSLFALGICRLRGSWAPLLSWVGGNVLAVLIALPLLLPMLGGFIHTQRALGVDLGTMEAGTFILSMFPMALMFGMSAWMFYPLPAHPIFYLYALPCSAAAWMIFPALVGRAKWKGLHVLTLALVGFGLILITRPHWVNTIMLHLPVFRSMRWPFRELVQFLFFFHLLLLLRPNLMKPLTQKLMAIGSTLFVAVPMLLYPIPPAYANLPLSKKIIFTGEFEQYWAHVRTHLAPGDRVAVLIPYEFYEQPTEVPYGLLGGFNYPMLAQVISASGYSHTVPVDQLYTKTIPFFPNGVFKIDQKAALIAERPGLKFITLENLHPIRISLSSKDGPTVDLTPYVPARFHDPQ